MGDVVSMESRLEAAKQEKIDGLRREAMDIKKQILDVVLGDNQYAITTDGSVQHALGDLELNESEREAIIGANIRLKEIYQELKQLGA